MPSVMRRVGLAVFVVLAAAATANVMALQPSGRRAHAPAPQTNAVEAARAALNASGEAAKAPVKPAVLNAELEPDLEGAVRRELQIRGYQPGEGEFTGYEARAAILAFESDTGLPLTGTVRSELLQHLLFGVARADVQPDAPTASAEVSASAREVIAAAQRALRAHGYQLDANGLPSLATQRAIREFEAQNGLPETGRVSAPLIAKLLGDGKSDSPPTADRLRARVASR